MIAALATLATLALFILSIVADRVHAHRTARDYRNLTSRLSVPR